MNFWTSVRIVARREIVTRLQSKGFIIPTLITVGLLLLAGVAGPKLVEALSSTTPVAVTSSNEALIEGLGDDFEAVVVASDEAAYAAVTDGDAKAAVVSDSASAAGVKVVGQRDVPSSLIGALSVTPEVELLDPNAVDPAIAGVIGLGFALVFFMTTMMFGMVIAQSVVEEKQTRIVEILLAAISARAILMGKIIGNSLLAFAQIVLYAVAVLLTIAVNGDQLNLDGLGVPIMWFVPLFTISFLMMSALYGAGASLVSRQEDIGSATSMLNFVVIVPYFVVVMFADNPAVMSVLSYIPFSSAIAVPMRSYLGDIAPWEYGLIVVLNLVAMSLALMLAARIYERAILRMGKAWSWSKALRATPQA
ncbi:MAG TPA: ABC transporter permease [Actinomycetales bacterium]|nr:ABC transporter permease [Actinomycetales bacterium]